MKDTLPAPVAFCFGVFELDPDGSELRRDGRTVHLQPQPLQILLCLVKQAGRIVSREELQKCLWTDDTFVGYEDGVNHAVNKIREALNDSAHNPRFIQTIPRLGYRFIAPVNVAKRGDSIEKQTDVQNWFGWPQRHWRALVAITGLLALALILLQARDWWKVRKPVRSIAVLPMASFSEDPADDHLADALTEELIARLSESKQLRVVSHTSVARYKRTTKSMREVGRELKVDAVVEGSVSSSGNIVHVTIKLVRIADEQQIWATVYEQNKDEIKGLQDELADHLLQEIEMVHKN